MTSLEKATNPENGENGDPTKKSARFSDFKVDHGQKIVEAAILSGPVESPDVDERVLGVHPRRLVEFGIFLIEARFVVSNQVLFGKLRIVVPPVVVFDRFGAPSLRKDASYRLEASGWHLAEEQERAAASVLQGCDGGSHDSTIRGSVEILLFDDEIIFVSPVDGADERSRVRRLAVPLFSHDRRETSAKGLEDVLGVLFESFRCDKGAVDLRQHAHRPRRVGNEQGAAVSRIRKSEGDARIHCRNPRRNRRRVGGEVGHGDRPLQGRDGSDVVLSQLVVKDVVADHAHPESSQRLQSHLAIVHAPYRHVTLQVVVVTILGVASPPRSQRPGQSHGQAER